uniref:intramembrane prenyl-peptidase Rce1 n=1 Tax=Chlamydomonas leiostraca TaxID=1034604 RepID=A0A7S0RB54_9CHLO|mmetsp:Transcript_178/g.404  ORF Transcript_178/g.404 Transcript_178/m.404 type:complete len:305 (+) Transcript_178:177-1091(+)|eukprot:CAMPEP_0202877198 /NCGR_PEP_ID=MMETSP1391-20130828/30262_1 /ASSEMBLY_ACC=CAM_ASM_000867 /TAXON_ID=1034604 /ORGANISM="Chlamydomonas leiostraca, Strain SAG 11-49" /LENGTH=304 /DNA_ID=CAMNT_0049559189 /DNA_START=141 /DNA_END=1055 /DNA_ORIENTATION=+
MVNWHAAGIALAGCGFSTLVYVGVLYARRTNLPRDDPETIKKRLTGVALACTTSWLPVHVMLRMHGKASGITPSLVNVLGLRWPGLAAIAAPAALTITLFACPLVHKLTTEWEELVEGPKAWLQQLMSAASQADVQAVLACIKQPFADDHLWLWRNLVVAPVSEEWVFRACMAPLLRMAGFSTTATVFITPTFFGTAHLHHLHDLATHQAMPLARAAATVGVQYAYTSVFGWYATLLFLNSGSVLPPIAAHMLCNWFGVPRFGQMAEAWGTGRMLGATVCSMAAFAALLPRLTAPALLGGPLPV